MTGTLGEADIQRMTRSGMPPLSPRQGLALFDAALASTEPVMLPVRLDLAALRARGEIPALFRGLIRTPARRAVTGADFAQHLAGLSLAEGHEMLLDLVCAQVAIALGHAGGSDIDPNQAFTELGFDSLTAVEVRNQLELTGGPTAACHPALRLPDSGGTCGHALRRDRAGAPLRTRFHPDRARSAGEIVRGPGGDGRGVAQEGGRPLGGAQEPVERPPTRTGRAWRPEFEPWAPPPTTRYSTSSTSSLACPEARHQCATSRALLMLHAALCGISRLDTTVAVRAAWI